LTKEENKFVKGSLVKSKSGKQKSKTESWTEPNQKSWTI